MRGLKATPMGPGLPPLVAADARSDSPHRGLPGIEPEQPNEPGDDDRGFRWSDRLRPSPQLLYHMLLAPARLPTASIRSQERHLPRLHHQPRPPPPASRLAPPRRTAQNVENSTLNTRRVNNRPLHRVNESQEKATVASTGAHSYEYRL